MNETLIWLVLIHGMFQIIIGNSNGSDTYRHITYKPNSITQILVHIFFLQLIPQVRHITYLIVFNKNQTEINMHQQQINNGSYDQPIAFMKTRSEIMPGQNQEHGIKRRNSYSDPKELLQNTKNFILVQVQSVDLSKIINMNLNPRAAEALLNTMDLTDDRGILLTRVTNQLLSSEVQNQDQQATSGFPTLFLRGLKRFSSVLSQQKDYQPLNEQEQDEMKVNCQICFDSVNINKTVEILPCKEIFCKECVIEYLNNKILISDVLNITCPSINCASTLDDTFITNLVSKETYEKYKKFLKLKVLSNDTLIRWCPRACDTYMRGDKGTKKLTCTNCRVEICFKCGNVYHGSVSCEAQLEQSYKQAMKNYIIYPCPGCKTPIQKNDGCNHMTCQKCRYEFCWICRRKCASNHYSSGYWNYIWGCPGKQNAKENPSIKYKLRMAALVIILIILGPPALVLGIVLGVLALTLVIVVILCSGPAVLYMKKVPRTTFDKYRKSYQYFVFVMWVILGIPLSPVTLVVYSVIVIGAAAEQTYRLCRWLCRNRFFGRFNFKY